MEELIQGGQEEVPINFTQKYCQNKIFQIKDQGPIQLLSKEYININTPYFL